MRNRQIDYGALLVIAPLLPAALVGALCLSLLRRPAILSKKR